MLVTLTNRIDKSNGHCFLFQTFLAIFTYFLEISDNGVKCWISIISLLMQSAGLVDHHRPHADHQPLVLQRLHEAGALSCPHRCHLALGLYYVIHQIFKQFVCCQKHLASHGLSFPIFARLLCHLPIILHKFPTLLTRDPRGNNFPFMLDHKEWWMGVNYLERLIYNLLGLSCVSTISLWRAPRLLVS